MFKLGLIGFPLAHSFSKKYFDHKFEQKKITNCVYNLYPIDNIKKFNKIINSNNLTGLNVTSPYKTKVIDYIDELDAISQATNSVNTVLFYKNKMKGFNTDAIGFQTILQSIKISDFKKALILGSGGVSKTVKYCLKAHNIETKIVSRRPQEKMIGYKDIGRMIKEIKLIINTTPLGQYPNLNEYPNIPYDFISSKHCCIDLIYNPSITIFLKKCGEKGAKTLGGSSMFTEQAEASWNIWRKLIQENV